MHDERAMRTPAASKAKTTAPNGSKQNHPSEQAFTMDDSMPLGTVNQKRFNLKVDLLIWRKMFVDELGT